MYPHKSHCSMLSTGSNPIDESSGQPYYRCAVPDELSRGCLHVGWKKAIASIQETSIDGFTILVPSRFRKALRSKRRWTLEFQSAFFEVAPEWYCETKDGRVQIGLCRLSDLTKPEAIRRPKVAWHQRAGMHDSGYASSIFWGLLLAAFMVLALPGVGDQLGTAPIIQSSFEWILKSLNQIIDALI